MFYSHTFLARKGPLGTVWCAAHLQHRLKKSHYTSTDISSTVDHILDPGVPIALRMSGHLLLGVVRIYSKKVDYLYQDCNFVLIGIRKAFAAVEVNLPEDATHAPFHSVTLPDTFELDALDLDDGFHRAGVQDHHVRSQEEITLTDQVPIGREPYITITFDQDFVRNSSHLPDASGLRDTPMETGASPLLPEDTNVGFRDLGPSNQTEVLEGMYRDGLPQDIPEIEVMRDAVHDFTSGNIPVWPDLRNDIIEPDRTLEELIMKEKETTTPVVEEMLDSGGQTLPSQQRQEPHSAASDHAPDIFDSHVSFGIVSPELALRSTPPIEQPPRQPRPRKRNQRYDESTVLTNRFMKKALEDSSDLLRKRKNCPCTALEVWKSYNRLKKGKIFSEPSTTGLCAELSNIFDKDFIATKPHLVLAEQAHPEPNLPQSPTFMEGVDMEIERLRNYKGPTGDNVLPDLMPSPNRSMHSPFRRNDFTPASPGNFGSHSEAQAGTSIGTGVHPTPDIAGSGGTLGSEMETPMTFFGEMRGIENTGLSDIPESIHSEEEDDELNFLAHEEYLTSGFKGTPEVDELPLRTRATAQFLKTQSSATPISSGHLSLFKILEGKSRKRCARMFFETLVLKSCDLIDIEQGPPYSDITLKVTSKLFKDRSLS